MKNITERTKKIRELICENINLEPSELFNLVAATFSISRQAIHVHFNNLLKEKWLIAKKKGKLNYYFLKPIVEKKFTEKIKKETTEYTVFDTTIQPITTKLNFPQNILDIWKYGFSEIVNNLIDHSNSKTIAISFLHNYLYTEISIRDQGIGIFQKLSSYFLIKETQYTLLELFKGKLSTDPKKHSGEGIFFTSRIFDSFEIVSGMYSFSKENKTDTWTLAKLKKTFKGTQITLRLKNGTDKQINDIFMQFVSIDEFYFNKTHVRIELAQYGNEYLVSRSQAKRVLMRLENFEEVIFDFKNIEKISPTFADELFRVSKLSLPNLKIRYINTNKTIEIFIKKALTGLVS